MNKVYSPRQRLVINWNVMIYSGAALRSLCLGKNIISRKQVIAFFIILRNSSSSANVQTAFWLPSIKLPMPTTDEEIN